MDEKTRCKITEALKKERPMSRGLCLSCKGGKLLCNRPSCPLMKKLDIQSPLIGKVEKEIFGPSPSIFVGWGGYPNVSVGQLTSFQPETVFEADDPSCWYGLGFDDIIAHRASLIRSKKKQGVRDRGRMTEKLQEIALSVKPIDVETHFKKKPTFNVEFNPVAQPMGPQGIVEKLRVADNPIIPRKVDYIVSDDLRSAPQLGKLFEKKFDVYYLSGVLSSGVLGFDDAKKIVPTRWSITAVDDTIGKQLIKKIKDYPSINEVEVYNNTYLGNHFEVVLIPGNWEFELFEAWSPDTLWTMGEDEPVIQVEYESNHGRTKYAFNEGGGYYAGRFAVTEAMNRMRKQARVVVFREIYDEYVVPVGVWEVRENVRNAFKQKPRKFTTLKQALADVQTRLKIPIRTYMKQSKVLTQQRITDYS